VNQPEVVSEHALSNSFLGNLVQVCIVTRDYRRTLEGLVRIGIGPWVVRTFDGSNLTERTYYGKPAGYAMKLCLADVGSMVWEVVQPLAGPSIYADFLDRHGDGIQHIGVDGNGVSYENRLKAFADRGYEPIQSGVFMNRVRFHYFSTGDDLKTIVEIFDVPKDFVFPEPDEWYPARPPKVG
jgi:hypothetical protein